MLPPVSGVRAWLPMAAAVAGIALTTALGIWQLARGNEKSALSERVKAAQNGPRIAIPSTPINADDVAWLRVEVRGRFAAEKTVYIDNRVLHGVAGYHVVTPLKIEGGERYVLVNRGWVAAAADRRTLPVIATPPGLVQVTGLATVPSERQFELSTRVAEGNVWQNLTLARYRATVPIDIQPVVVQQEDDADDGLKREWSVIGPSPDRNYGYAFQWFAMAAAILIYYLVTRVRKRPA
jgi:surfeit locus 1 family protein